MASNKALFVTLQYYKEAPFLTSVTLSTLGKPLPC